MGCWSFSVFCVPHGQTLSIAVACCCSDRRRNTPKSGQNRSESLCAGLWAPCRVFGAWFGFVLGPNPGRNRRFPAGSLNIFGALLAQPRWCHFLGPTICARPPARPMPRPAPAAALASSLRICLRSLYSSSGFPSISRWPDGARF